MLERGRTRDDPRAPETTLVTSGIGAVIIEPLTAVGPPDSASDRRDYIDTLRMEGLQTRGNISRAIDEMFDDPTPLSGSQMGRVSDHAYLAMRRVTFLDSTPEAGRFSRSRFLALSVAERDTEMEALRPNPNWAELVSEGFSPRGGFAVDSCSIVDLFERCSSRPLRSRVRTDSRCAPNATERFTGC